MSEFDHWLPLHVGDFISDTMHLTTLQRGAYLMLIMHYWKRRELPDDDHILAQIAGVSSRHWARIGGAVKALFTRRICDGKTRLEHGRLVRELEKAKAVSEARKKAGAKGLEKKHGWQLPEKNLAIANTRAREPTALEEVVVAPTGLLRTSSGALPERDERHEGARAPAAPPQPQADQQPTEEPRQPPTEEQLAAVAETLKAIQGYVPRPVDPPRTVSEQLEILRAHSIQPTNQLDRTIQALRKLNGTGDTH